MTKEDDKKKTGDNKQPVTVETLKKDYPELIKQISENVSAETIENMSMEFLNQKRPDLVKQIKAETAANTAMELGRLSAEQVKKELPQLYARIAADAAGASVANLSEKGFLLSQTDPFAEGTLRTFAALTKQPGLRLPYVLPFKNKNTKAAVQGYIIRAEGGGDTERGKAARKALEKCI